MPLSNTAMRDIETVLHPYTNLATHRENGPLVIQRAAGIHIYDDKGKPYIEGMSGLWCTSLGYGNEELAETAAQQMRTLPFTHLFGGKSHDPAIELAEKLKEIAPVPVSKVFFCCSGSEANDTQMKLVWYMNNALGRPNKKKIIARTKGYHGVTIASGSLTGLPANHADFDLPIANVLHTSCPHYYRFGQDGESEAEFTARMVADLEVMIEREGPETVAAFIAEPVMGAGGVIVPPAGYFPAIAEVCRRHDILMIADEVICGFGRTGNMFGSTTFGFTPDNISVAKAITSAYFPVGAVMVSEEMYRACVDESRKIGTFGHGYTYSGHPVGAALALKTLEIYERERIVEKVAGKAPLFQSRLAALGDHPLVGEARGVGLLGAVELVEDKQTRRSFAPSRGAGAACVRFAEEEGLIVRAVGGDNIAVCPPLIITEAEIGELFDRLARALDRTRDWLARQG